MTIEDLAKLMDKRFAETIKHSDEKFAEAIQHSDEKLAQTMKHSDEKFTTTIKYSDKKFEELAILVNNGFNTTQSFNHQRFDRLEKRFDILEKDHQDMTMKLSMSLIDSNWWPSLKELSS